MSSTGYSGFANVYDKLMADYPYSAILRFIEQNLVLKGKRGLDLCAGTGTVTVRLAEKGAIMTALDIEPEMLNRARDKARGAGFTVKFIEGDVNDLPEMKPFDFIVSTCDGFNYVENPETFAKSLFHLLVEGGKLVLEFSSLDKAQKKLSDGLFYEDGEEETWFFDNEFDEESNTVYQELTIFRKLPNGNYTRTDDASTQYFYDNARLLSVFSAAGFSNVKLLETGDFSEAKQGAERLTLVAERR